MHTTKSESKDEEDINFQPTTSSQVYGAYKGTKETVLYTEETIPQRKKRTCFSCPPQGIVNNIMTSGVIYFMILCILWLLSGPEVLPGGNLFRLVIIFYSARLGGTLLKLIRIPTVPPLPPLLGVLLAGFIIRNIPSISKHVRVPSKWSSTLRSSALTIILIRAGLGLDPQALRQMKTGCFRLSFGPCIVEACTAAVVSHFVMDFPWQWGFLLGFVLGAVSPAVVVPSMLHLQEAGYGIEKGIPTLLIAASSMDDVVAITGFNTVLNLIFSKGTCVITLCLAVFVRILSTFVLMCFAGFNFKEKIFIALSWMPKATVQAVLGPLALETARLTAPHLEPYSKDVMTVAFLAILITAPNGALLISILGPRMLSRRSNPSAVRLHLPGLRATNVIAASQLMSQ
ncbi:sodium/hydrogen exchanger 9B1 isoform X3 [Heterocephalus glaber]|uniref:Sodium/hydrogen exchanger 9B1 isoform X3 n=1 Tax=Heterocephalus glaber TaxID=10181 RepID=A0AAX6RZ13_HETGA|nr:sodium/hydrogen exchanger 9B1 isoform X3 [Heterocephalus glaber]